MPQQRQLTPAVYSGAVPRFMALMSAFLAQTKDVPKAWATMRREPELHAIQPQKKARERERSLAALRRPSLRAERERERV